MLLLDIETAKIVKCWSTEEDSSQRQQRQTGMHRDQGGDREEKFWDLKCAKPGPEQSGSSDQSTLTIPSWLKYSAPHQHHALSRPASGSICISVFLSALTWCLTCPRRWLWGTQSYCGFSPVGQAAGWIETDTTRMSAPEADEWTTTETRITRQLNHMLVYWSLSSAKQAHAPNSPTSMCVWQYT